MPMTDKEAAEGAAFAAALFPKPYEPLTAEKLEVALKEAAGSTGFSIRQAVEGPDFTLAFATAVMQHLSKPKPPKPKEPPVWTVVRVIHSGSSLIDRPYTPESKWVRADWELEDASWFRLSGSGKYAESRTWTEVLALCDPGTLPEVLRPEATS